MGCFALYCGAFSNADNIMELNLTYQRIDDLLARVEALRGYL